MPFIFENLFPSLISMNHKWSILGTEPCLGPIHSCKLTSAGFMCLGKTKGKGTFGKVKQGTHDPTNEKVFIYSLDQLSSNRRF